MTNFDITDSLAPSSDQLDAVDLLGGPRIFTISDVSKGNVEQPVNVHLAEFPRVWRPGKSMRRVLAACWGTDASKWIGQRVELFCDESVMFGGEKVGGTRISRLTGIDKPKSIPLIIKRGKSTGYKVAPLPDAAPAKDWDAILATAQGLTDVGELGNLWRTEEVGSAPEHIRDAIKARGDELQAASE